MKKNRKNPEFMHFTIPAAELKQQGYTFQKLFARNYICYHKELGAEFSIWCWKARHEIEVGDFGGHSKAVVEFLMKHIPDVDVEEGSYSMRGYVKIAINRDTGEVSIAKRTKDFLNSDKEDINDEEYSAYVQTHSLHVFTRGRILKIQEELKNLGVEL